MEIFKKKMDVRKRHQLLEESCKALQRATKDAKDMESQKHERANFLRDPEGVGRNTPTSDSIYKNLTKKLNKLREDVESRNEFHQIDLENYTEALNEEPDLLLESFQKKEVEVYMDV